MGGVGGSELGGTDRADARPIGPVEETLQGTERIYTVAACAAGCFFEMTLRTSEG
jgi:hypothetical protein